MAEELLPAGGSNMGCFEDLMDFREEVERLKKERAVQEDGGGGPFERTGEVRESPRESG